MKRNRLLSCVLAAAMVLTLSAAPAMAAYPDVTSQFQWAESYINDMTEKGVFTGIQEGGQLLFKPAKEMTAVEALALCARISVETAVRQQIGRDRAEQIAGLTGEENFWARDEFATCIEAGILSYAELKELWQSGDINRPLAKENFALYLVRAMQLAPMAENLATYSLDFTDKATITPGLEPYVYLLNTYGIVTGNENKAFAPKSTVTRAVAATMLSRAMKFMEENGTNVELAEYTDYAWEAGVIMSVEPNGKDKTRLVLRSEISGDKTIDIPTSTPIYENSMLVKIELLKTGTYARVCFDEDDTPMAVRLSGSVETVAGTVVGVSDEAILLSVNGATQTVKYDRFTEVQVGKKTGDRSLIDPEAGYTDAVCRIDQLGHLAAVQLTGGTRREEGILKSVDNLAGGGVNVVISGFDGQLQQITVPAGAEVTANGFTASFNSSYAGAFVTLRVSNDDGTASAATMDTVTQYVQGAVKSTGTASGVHNVTVTDLSTSKSATYDIDEKAELYYNGAAVSAGAVQKDWFVTIRLSAGDVAALYGYPGSTRTEGTISGISYPGGTTKEIISVTTTQGTTVPFEVDLKEQPQVQYNGKTGTLSALRTGDSVVITVRYGAVTLIDAVPQSADVSGTITGKSETLANITIDVELDNNSGAVTYVLSKSISVTKDGKLVSLDELKVGSHVAMITSGSEVLSIEIDKDAGGSSTQLTGTVILADSKGKTIMFRTSNNDVIQVAVPTGTTIQQVSGGTISLSRLETDDVLDIYGEYVNGVFTASLIVKKG